jgi:hypothetical protein
MGDTITSSSWFACDPTGVAGVGRYGKQEVGELQRHTDTDMYCNTDGFVRYMYWLVLYGSSQ